MHLSALVAFLAGLSENNNKAWFVMNQPSYEILREEFTALVADVIARTARFDPLVAQVNAKKAQFRIYRDVRFSKDKRPYKTQFSAAISPAGKSGNVPVYYFHIDAQGVLLTAAGCYMPDKETLARIRTALAADPAGLESALRDRRFRKQFGDLDDSDRLARPPKGYAADLPQIERLKLKSYIAAAETDLSDVAPDDLATTIADSFKAVYPLVAWLRSVAA